MKKQIPITPILNALQKNNTFVFLDSSLSGKENKQSWIFINPSKVISTHKPSGIRACFSKMQKEKEKGNYLAGFLSYEAGYAFCKKLKAKQSYDFPLLWIGVFKQTFIYDHSKGRFLSANFKINPETLGGEELKTAKMSNLRLDISKRSYIKNINKIKKLIAAGDTYQVNYTTKLKFNFKGSDSALYQQLRKNQPVGYGAFIRSKKFSILSFSPELFFRQAKENICVRPMKGTMPRGKNGQEDLKIQKFLRNDLKNQAENIMIVDLLRNDLGKISQTASVKTTELFCVEKYKTLLQMTSTVKSKLKKGLSLYELFQSLHPSGSVTGAPKIRTMEIIKQLEQEDRKIYTGSIGYIGPKNNAAFNVGIRTILLNGRHGEMGIGSGVTYSSCPESEWTECKLKANFLSQPNFQLIETMLCSKSNIFLLDLHLKRLRKSAKFFSFAFDLKKIRAALKQKLGTLDFKENHRLRLLLDVSGNISLQSSTLTPEYCSGNFPKICLSLHRLDPENIYLYHKTTQRKLYDREFKKHKKQGFFDIIFINKNKELCEGAISNIFIMKKGIYYTPPVSCGLLPGVFREHFIKTNKKLVKEKVLFLEDLKTADSIYCANSVRKMVRVELANSA